MPWCWPAWWRPSRTGAGRGGGGTSGEQIVFDVGDPQGIDSMNPLIGVTVAAYEAWNIQYATLTDKAAKDFSTIPGLAESWEGSEDGKTWTYKLRPGMKWSDGKPLTAEDVAWTINTSREEEWLNHSAVDREPDAEAPDDTTLVIRSKVPRPQAADHGRVHPAQAHLGQAERRRSATKYDGNDGVGSGPFVLEKFEKGQFARFRANPNYWGGKPAVDKVVLRKFNNPDAMVAALKTGELDAADDIPTLGLQGSSRRTTSIDTVEGYQGAMSEIAINGGDGLKKPHPALLDPEGAQGDRARDRQGDDRRPRARRARPAGRDAQRLARPEVDAEICRRRDPRVRPRQGERDPRRGRLQGHGRRRRAGDARMAASR